MLDQAKRIWSPHALSVCVAVLVAAATAPALVQAQEGRVIPVVTSQFLTDALAILSDSGFVNVEVARQLFDDMPRDVVLRQFPDPRPQQSPAARFPPPRFPPSTRILLVVVEPLPVLPDLTGWRADRALAHVSSLHRDIEATLRDPRADSTQVQVIAQSVSPGPVQPPQSVVLATTPVPPETIVQEVPVVTTDTVSVVDTVTVQRPSRSQIALGGIVLTVAGLGLGLLGCRVLGPKVPVGPGGGAPASTVRRDGTPRRDAVDERPAHEPEIPDLPDFSPVIVDEAVWASSGRVIASRRSAGGDGGTT